MFDLALLTFTNTSGVYRLEAEDFRHPEMALRPDQLKKAEILYYNVDDNTVRNLALLNDHDPWTCACGACTPNICEVMPLMDPYTFDLSLGLNYAFSLGALPELDIEAINVDPDALDRDPTYLGSQLIDEMIVNRRSVNQEMAKRELIKRRAIQKASIAHMVDEVFKGH